MVTHLNGSPPAPTQPQQQQQQQQQHRPPLPLTAPAQWADPLPSPEHTPSAPPPRSRRSRGRSRSRRHRRSPSRRRSRCRSRGRSRSRSRSRRHRSRHRRRSRRSRSRSRSWHSRERSPNREGFKVFPGACGIPYVALTSPLLVGDIKYYLSTNPAAVAKASGLQDKLIHTNPVASLPTLYFLSELDVDKPVPYQSSIYPQGTVRMWGNHMKSLVSFVTWHKARLTEQMRRLQTTGEIKFSMLRWLFEAGTKCVSFKNGLLYGGIVTNSYYVDAPQPAFRVSSVSINSDGKHFYKDHISYVIHAFPGVCDILSLSVVPFNPDGSILAPKRHGGPGITNFLSALHPKAAASDEKKSPTDTGSPDTDISMADAPSSSSSSSTAAQRPTTTTTIDVGPKLMGILRHRGSMFRRVAQGFHHMEYRGAMMHTSAWLSGGRRSDASGRVMVDIEAFNTRAGSPRKNKGAQFFTGATDEIEDFELFMCWPTVGGFGLANKQWGEMCVENLMPVTWNDNAFKQLVLPANTKALIKSLVTQIAVVDQSSSPLFTDIIAGKNGGVMFLLHGPSGTGKTLTAETVAELLHRPLYSVSAGQLGTEPAALEKELKHVLEVASHWRAVVLIDEADVFLEKRSSDDIVRSSCVSIFLRLLEYHSGVIFATTNRFVSLDDAVHSRVSVAFKYPELDFNARKQVWYNCLTAAHIPVNAQSKSGVVVDRLAGFSLNGRQIRNSVRLAQALARDEGVAPTLSHISRTLLVSTRFHLAKEEQAEKEKARAFAQRGGAVDETKDLQELVDMLSTQ